jgi:hypothetical protein
MDCTNVVSLSSVVSAIKNGRWKSIIEPIRNEPSKDVRSRLKKNIPAILFNGVFEERTDAGIVHYNNLMIVDIDELDSKKLSSLKKKLKSNIYVFCFFDSPSGGLKVLIPVDSPAEKHNTSAFGTIEDMFIDSYGVKIDSSGKNLSRLCYVSYDDDLYVNYDCSVLHIDENYQEEYGFVPVPNNYIPSGFTKIYDTAEIMTTAVKMVKASKTGGYHKGNRNNFVFVLSCLMCEFGVPHEQALHLIFDRYNTLGWKECRSTVSSAYRRTMKNFGTREIGSRRNSAQQNLL